VSKRSNGGFKSQEFEAASLGLGVLLGWELTSKLECSEVNQWEEQASNLVS
jgi:hypothetical protein